MTRIDHLKNLLSEYKCDAIIVTHPIDLYYLTKQNISAGTLIVTTESAHLFVDGRYFEKCKESLGFKVIEARANNWTKELKELPQIKSIGFDANTTSYSNYLDLKEKLNAKLIPVKGIGQNLRLIKDSEEIEKLKKAATLCREGYHHICNLLQEGVTEKELSTALEIFWKQKADAKLAFEPIIAFGTNSSMPHYTPGNVPLKKGDTVLIDIGVELENYCSDMTRTLFFHSANKEIRHIYSIVKQANEAAIQLCTPGTLIKSLDEAARSLIETAGFGKQFLHSLGHGLGLEVHELPFLSPTSTFGNQTLKPGMVITIEPGIYIPGVGGVRIEDTLVITASGHENLTNLSKDIKIY
ncbi:MAG: Xaa-Pro peptidase family protein [Waddliaceae bacterium]